MAREITGDSFESTLFANGCRPLSVVRPQGKLSNPAIVEVYVAPTNGHLPDLDPTQFLPRTKVTSIEENPNGYWGPEKKITALLSELEVIHLKFIAERDQRAIERGYIKEFYPLISL